jgi:hypothetical protein
MILACSYFSLYIFNLEPFLEFMPLNVQFIRFLEVGLIWF